MRNPCKIQLDLDNPSLFAVDQYLLDAKRIAQEIPDALPNAGNGAPVPGSDTEISFKAKFACLKEIMRRVVHRQAIIFSNYQLRYAL